MNVCWNLTNLCDESCFYCFRELIEKPRPLEDNILVMNKLFNVGVKKITYAGGEPLIYNGLVDLLRYARSLGIENALITNGKSLNIDNILEYLEYVDKLTFSIDSPSEYVNNCSGRGVDHYRHIKSILPYVKKYYPEIPLEINTVATRDNLRELEYMLEALVSELSCYGIKKWKISRFCPLRGYAKERKNLFYLNDSEFHEIEKEYSDQKAPFLISVRNSDSIEENIIVSPKGSLKKAHLNNEYVLVPDIIKTPVYTMKKILKEGGNNRV